jgi:hypothetical protein
MRCQPRRRPSQATRVEQAVPASGASRDACCGVDRLAQGQSQRAVAEALGAARSTLQDWLGQAPSDEVPSA